jgi:hypothetical protein
MPDWMVEQNTDGKLDLYKDRRIKQWDCDDEEEVVRIIQRQDPAAKNYLFVSLDGDRERRKLKPKRPRPHRLL